MARETNYKAPPSRIDPALHNTPEEWARQQAEIQRVMAQLPAHDPGQEPTAHTHNGQIQYSAPPQVFMPAGGRQVTIVHKDFSFGVVAQDVHVTEYQLGILMPDSIPVQEMRPKCKFKIQIGDDEFPVMYAGGNFVFGSGSAKLRVLSFMRIQG